jgi:cystathionine beta-lyase/cystathionine gamma-synthase
MTHKGMPEDVRENAGIYDVLIRSVGVEDVDDLLQDLLEALERAN